MAHLSELDAKILALGETVTSVLAEIQLRVLVVEQVLAEHQIISQDEFDQTFSRLRDAKTPLLKAETSRHLWHRYQKYLEREFPPPKPESAL